MVQEWTATVEPELPKSSDTSRDKDDSPPVSYAARSEPTFHR